MAEGRKPRSGALDAVLGERVRRVRRERGLSQTALAEQLGITFQQVQKYENGSNRISALVLVRLAAALDVSVHVLLSDLDESPAERADPTPDGQLDRLIAAFQSIESADVRFAVLSIVENLAADPVRRTVTVTPN